MTLWLCHKCCDISNPTGEACTINIRTKDCTPEYLGCYQCYPIRPKFYPVITKEEINHHLQLFNSPGWEIHIFEPREGAEGACLYSNEKTVAQKSIEVMYIFLESLKKSFEKEFGPSKTKDELTREYAERFFKVAIPCRIDPLSKIKK